MGAELQTNKMRKIHFIIQKKVDFGKTVYVVGNIHQLGNWNVQSSLRLCWAKDHYWTGFVALNADHAQPIEYKYVVGNWEDPLSDKLEWQAGKTNRTIENPFDPQHIICENTWNMEKITLNLLVPDDGKVDEYCVIGDCKELGGWKKSFRMSPNKKRNPLQLSSLKTLDHRLNYNMHSLTFKIYRAKPKIHYYYIRKTHNFEIERHPGRKYELETSFNSHPKCLKVAHLRGDTDLFEICNFKELNYSPINEHILLGPYLKTPEDFQLLKEQGVTSILSLQTHEDLALHCLTEDYLRQQSRDMNIELYIYAIQDMSKQDFLSKCNGAIELLKNLVKNHRKVYVHCSAGVYRSPQIVVLYLILTEKYSPEEAVEFVKSRHPFARPNQQIVTHALEVLLRDENYNNSIITHDWS